MSLLCLLRRTRSNNSPSAMSTPGAQVMVSNAIFQSEGSESSAEIPDSLMVEAGNIDDRPGVLCSARK